MDICLMLFGIIFTFVMWFIWGCINAFIVILFSLGPMYLLDITVMRFSVNNVINWVAKCPVVGPLLAAILYSPFWAFFIMLGIWQAFKGYLMIALFFTGAGSDTGKNMVELIERLNGNWGAACDLKFYYDHMQWLWGAGLTSGTTPFHNGVWCDLNGDGSPLITIIKIIVLLIPGLVSLMVAGVPVVWGFLKIALAWTGNLTAEWTKKE